MRINSFIHPLEEPRDGERPLDMRRRHFATLQQAIVQTDITQAERQTVWRSLQQLAPTVHKEAMAAISACDNLLDKFFQQGSRAIRFMGEQMGGQQWDVLDPTTAYAADYAKMAIDFWHLRLQLEERTDIFPLSVPTQRGALDAIFFHDCSIPDDVHIHQGRPVHQNPVLYIGAEALAGIRTLNLYAEQIMQDLWQSYRPVIDKGYWQTR